MGKTIRKSDPQHVDKKAIRRRERMIRDQKRSGAYFPPGAGDWPAIIDFKHEEN